MSEALGEGCNDLADGDSDVEGRGVRRRKDADNSGEANQRKNAKSKQSEDDSVQGLERVFTADAPPRPGPRGTGTSILDGALRRG
eukprot:2161782-Prymnesium_polylepis.1